jgi:hypothetical protein
MAVADFIEWIGQPNADGLANLHYVDNAQVRYLAAERGGIVQAPVGEVTREMLERAKWRLDHAIDLVLLLERFDESMVLTKHHLNWRGCYYVTSNINRARRRDTIDQQTFDLLARYNELDLELYEHARKRFERDLAAIENFPAKLARYRQRNRCYSRVARPFYGLIPLVRAVVRWLGRIGR